MGELIQVEMKGDRVVTDSLNVAVVFAREHRNVLRSIRELEKDAPNFEQMFFKCDKPDSYGRSREAYEMTRDGFTLLAMGFTGKDALKWKMKYIEAFNLMEQKLNSPEFIMSRALRIADETIERLTKKIELDKPKTLFADAVTAASTSILVRDLAKLLNQNGVDIGEKRLYAWLRENEYICKSGTSPTQKAMDLKLFEVEERTIEGGDRQPMIARTTKVTGKGQVYFMNKFLGVQSCTQS